MQKFVDGSTEKRDKLFVIAVERLRRSIKKAVESLGLQAYAEKLSGTGHFPFYRIIINAGKKTLGKFDPFTIGINRAYSSFQKEKHLIHTYRKAFLHGRFFPCFPFKSVKPVALHIPVKIR
jgi:hypothetical protein